MKIVWDENKKNRINRKKHRVSFETAQLVFEDPLHVSRLDRIEGGEQRWQTIGLINGLILMLIAHTARKEDGRETIRLISARKANQTERSIYEQG